ncbi:MULTISPECIES: ABC transporter ATP-binding protein [Clostridium]|uniref:Macrolide export ATP-binding/permease protein MacB n=3 Tax=Clostridium TaxID=1485 RepID=D8GTG4_CLOLD|nr:MULTISPECIES: ABC transporter ATP-binding protein [Clostridium]ADK14613.1 predicted ABC transporter, ATPase component [Clostridium ljungdahlii DSM 13528]AGY77853.1 ABC transporter ATP-binding protein [Clostridium autoethanogenum DSM 10061]ALU37987.1 putative ABC transporter [Clostridium autoethanogenum DSM 10061]OAA85850.1 Macrolide export ATP-binding/permease protein MacB [Clostridium ljungdahlii DSM 13528]OVY50751.1 Macrolide export ATP-binding/permease protein MacB [Clostridium autoethan
MIDIKNVCKYYTMGDTVVKALDDINLSIDENEFISIIGPSGSGKSTLMNILGCLDIPDSGSYIFDNVNVENASENELSLIRNKQIGFIFQNFNLLPKLNAVENVEVPLLYRGINQKECRKLALDYLEKVGLKGREHHKPNQLSGGQQQRVAIARALVGSPKIILADEPTGALDSKTSAELMEFIKELHKKGQTIILITHDPNVAKQAERIITIRDGKLYA